MEIQFLITKNEYAIVPPSYSCSLGVDDSSLYRPVESLHQQAKDLGLTDSIAVSTLNIQDLPSQVKAFLVVILNENSLVPDDYIARILAMNNLHRNAAMFCGPVETVFTNRSRDLVLAKILSMYKSYKYDSFSSFISCLINGDYNNYPLINGCVFSGRYYNLINGYKPVRSPRYVLENNIDALHFIDKAGPIIYSNRLSIGYFITTQESQPEQIVKRFYEIGYCEAKIDALYKREKGGSNVKILELEYELSRLKEKVDTTLVNACKCMYDIGYYESLNNTLLI